MTACSNSAANEQPIQNSVLTEDNHPVQPEESTTFANGSGTESEPYQITTKEQFLTLAASVNDGSCGGYAGEYIQLTADIDLDGVV